MDGRSTRGAAENICGRERQRLSLSPGAKVGHRSLMRYYKQRFGAERALVLSHHKNAVGRVLRQYRALGWGSEGEGTIHRGQPVPRDRLGLDVC